MAILKLVVWIKTDYQESFRGIFGDSRAFCCVWPQKPYIDSSRGLDFTEVTPPKPMRGKRKLKCGLAANKEQSMCFSHYRLFWGFVAAVVFPLTMPTQAAIINWSVPSNISGDSDVITTGTLVDARNMSQNQLTTTVNGVFFDIFPIPNGGNGISGLNNIFAFAYNNAESSDTAYGSSNLPYSSLSLSYRTLLSSGAGSSTGNPLTLNLLGLTNGASYLFQWWTNDSGLAFGGVNTTTATATNSVTLDENTTNSDGGMGQWVSGTFTATGTSQTITFSGPRPAINAYQLRVVPEPGSLSLLIFGGLTIVHCRRRK